MARISRFRRPGPIVCRRAVALMTDYLEGHLPARDRARLEEHLAGCPHCTEYLAQLRTTIDALGRARPADLPPEAVSELVDLYREWRSG